MTKQLEDSAFNDEEDFTETTLTDENITQDQINEMKMLGLEKPDGVSWERWQRLQDIRYEHELMVHLAATGMSQNRIAEELNYDPVYVSKCLNNPEIKEKINKQINEIYGTDIKKALRDRAIASIGVVDDILQNGKESERASMAKWALEHTVGKASQEIIEKKTSLTELIIRIDQMEQDQLRDVGSNPALLTKPKDHFDTVIEQMIPKDMVVGKRSTGEGQTE